MKNIGLDSKVVKRRLLEGKTPWENKEETLINCQRAYMEHQMKVPKIPSEKRERSEYHSTTQPKSKISKPESRWKEHLEHRRSVTLKEPSSSSKPRTREKEESEERYGKERETKQAQDRFGKRPRSVIQETSSEKFISEPEQRAKEQLE